MTARTHLPAAAGIMLFHSQFQLYLALGRKLKALGVAVHFYVRSEAERNAVVATLDGQYDSVTIADLIPDTIREPVTDREALAERALAQEARLGERLNRIAAAHRQAGRGYSPGSLNYPARRRYTDATYWQYLNAISTQVAFWEREVEEKGLTVLVDAGKEAASVARSRGIAYRWLVFARYQSNRAWAVDEYQSLPQVREIFETLAPPENPPEPEQYLGAVRKIGAFWKRQTLPNLAYRVARNCTIGIARALYLRNRELLSFDALVAYPIRVYRHSRRIRRLSTATVESLQGIPYVYLPMQKEPEQALLMAAPESTDQVEIAISVSRALPAGTMLAISEHSIAIGRRPESFYAQLAALPNVVFFSFESDPLARIANAVATVTIAGTAAFEAATLGRPAIVFGQHVVPAFLPNVMTVRQRGDLEAALTRASSGVFDPAAMLADGKRFEEALKQASFPLGEYGWRTSEEKGVEPPDEVVDMLLDRLLQSLRDYPAENAAVRPAARAVS
jgi:hypothetical protein